MGIDLDAYFGHQALPEDYKSGFVALIGRPNAGKSTLLNQVLGQKIAIVSDKPQTTRTKIQGIYTDEEMQVIFFDTPGLHKPRHKLGDYMNRAAEVTFGDVDVSPLAVVKRIFASSWPPYPGQPEKRRFFCC